MFLAYSILAVLYSAMLVFSAVGKLRLDPQQVQIIHAEVGVPLSLFPVLAACELAGAAGLLAGIRWRSLGIAAAVGVVVYFVGAIASHIVAGDTGGSGGAIFMLVVAAIVLALRVKAPQRRLATT
jgi:hypothetical protein